MYSQILDSALPLLIPVACLCIKWNKILGNYDDVVLILAQFYNKDIIK